VKQRRGHASRKFPTAFSNLKSTAVLTNLKRSGDLVHDRVEQTVSAPTALDAAASGSSIDRSSEFVRSCTGAVFFYMLLMFVCVGRQFGLRRNGNPEQQQHV